MRWPGQLGPVVCGVGALVHGEGYHIRHSSRMGLRRPLEERLERLGIEYLWLPNLGDGEGLRVLCDRMHAVRWVVGQLWCHQYRVVLERRPIRGDSQPGTGHLQSGFADAVECTSDVPGGDETGGMGFFGVFEGVYQ